MVVALDPSKQNGKVIANFQEIYQDPHDRRTGVAVVSVELNNRTLKAVNSKENIIAKGFKNYRTQVLSL